MLSDLETAALRFRSQLLRSDRQAARAMASAYSASWQRIRVEIEALQEELAHLPPRAPLYLVQRQRRLAALQRQVEAELREFAALATEITTAGQRQAATAAQGNAGELMVQAALDSNAPGLVDMFDRLPTPAIEAMIGFASDGSPLHDLFAALGPEVGRGMETELVDALALGTNPRITAARMRREYGLGLTRALTIARTEQVRAYREVTRQTYSANADILDGWVWMSARDLRTCVACWAMHGTVHSVDETLDDHPNGRCVMVPLIKGRAARVGKGEDLFRSLPEERQRQIMGQAAHLAYQDGKVSLRDFAGQKDDRRWGTMRYARSLRELLGAEMARRYKAMAAANRETNRAA